MTLKGNTDTTQLRARLASALRGYRQARKAGMVQEAIECLDEAERLSNVMYLQSADQAGKREADRIGDVLERLTEGIRADLVRRGLLRIVTRGCDVCRMYGERGGVMCRACKGRGTVQRWS